MCKDQHRSYANAYPTGPAALDCVPFLHDSLFSPYRHHDELLPVLHLQAPIRHLGSHHPRCKMLGPEHCTSVHIRNGIFNNPYRCHPVACSRRFHSQHPASPSGETSSRVCYESRHRGQRRFHCENNFSQNVRNHRYEILRLPFPPLPTCCRCLLTLAFKGDDLMDSVDLTILSILEVQLA